MIKQILFTLLLSTSLFSGVIQSSVEESNNIPNQLDRIETKLDILLNQLIQEEIKLEKRDNFLKETFNSSKEKINDGKDWIIKKIQNLDTNNKSK